MPLLSLGNNVFTYPGARAGQGLTALLVNFSPMNHFALLEIVLAITNLILKEKGSRGLMLFLFEIYFGGIGAFCKITTVHFLYENEI